MHGVLVTSKSPGEGWELRPAVKWKLDLQKRLLTPLNEGGQSVGFVINEYLTQYLPVH